MTIADRAVLVTGANRGIGQALVAEALRRGAKRVYARYAPALGPFRWTRHAPDPRRDQRCAYSGSRRESRISRYPHQ
jgi:NAD(P)-dependent dehydrogenase (short-subunit alcohol dehydrogenase family)